MGLPPLDPFQAAPDTRQNGNISTAKRVFVFARLQSGHSVAKIMKEERLTRAQVIEIESDQALAALSDRRILAKTKEILGGSFYMAADQLLREATDPRKVARLPADRAMVSAAIAFDKARLADGLSTENLSVRGIVGHLEEKRKEAEELRAQLLDSLKG